MGNHLMAFGVLGIYLLIFVIIAGLIFLHRVRKRSSGTLPQGTHSTADSLRLAMDVNIQSLMDAGENVRQSEEKFRAIFENAPYPISIRDFESGRFLEANNALLTLMGIAPEELPHVKAEEYPLLNDDEAERICAELKAKGSVANRETTILKKDGTEAHMTYSSSLLEIQGEKRLITMAVDETERKLAEKAQKRLQAQLMQSQKMEAVGILAGGVAHDFNNMLGAIIGYTELLMGRMPSSDGNHKHLAKILDTAKRSAGLTRQLLAFARKETVSPMLFDLNKSIDTSITMIRRLISENIELSWLPGSGPCVVRMDPSQLDQILLNLCLNARDAIADVGRISIETSIILLEEAYCGTQDRVGPGSYALLMVSDNGCGMNGEILDHIFEPFFTTKETGRGTGMGLASVYGIVKQNGGAINVYSEPGNGTTFRVHLPLIAAEAGKTISTDDAEIPKGRGETVLLVEDDLMLLEIGTATLERFGYTVLAASAPEDAIRISRETEDEIHLFITDVIMPNMNGRDLADRLQSMRPGIRHLFMSGYSASIIAPQGVLATESNFIQKPFSSKDIAVKVRQVMDA